MDDDFVKTILQEGTLTLEGRFTFGSNYTFLANLEFNNQIVKVVYKPQRGEIPLWDFTLHSLAGREVAAYLLSKALGWGLIPPTVFRRKKLPLGSGSLQLYIEHDSARHYFNFNDEQRLLLKPVVLFDLVANNADRKGGHVFFDHQGYLWAIDHGLCFHEQDKLRTVIWDFAGEPIPGNLLHDLCVALESLQKGSPLAEMLASYLLPVELGALRQRIEHYMELKQFPQPPQDRRPFPWPPV